ncbi:MAG: helix-turn-helix domain-containing protein [Aquabacterium sp.]
MTKHAVFYWAAGRGMYVGKVEREYKRSCSQSTLMVSMGDELELIIPQTQERVTSKSILVPAGAEVLIRTHGNPVTLGFLDSNNRDATALIQRMKGSLVAEEQAVYYNLSGAGDVVAFGEHLQKQRPSATEAENIADEWLFAQIRRQSLSDPRVDEAIRIIRATLSENISVDLIAAQVGLSASRLTEIFKNVTGVPIRRFRLWQRVLATAANLKDCNNLTDAAITAGFADYAQFSRTYRQLAGGAPSDAQKNTEIHAEQFLAGK